MKAHVIPMLIACVCILWACNSEEQQLIGTWRETKTINDNGWQELDPPEHPNTYFKFVSDNTYVREKTDSNGAVADGSTITGNWHVEDHALKLTFNSCTGGYMKFNLDSFTTTSVILNKTEQTTDCQTQIQQFFLEKE